MALDAGYDSEDIAKAVYPRFWSWSGEESGMWARWVEQFDQLHSHEDERIQKVGELGKAAAEASRDRALDSERQEAVRGIGSRWS